MGWKDRNWRGPKVACAVCGRRVRGGITHYKDASSPPANVLCRRCFARAAPAGFYSAEATDKTISTD